MDKDIRPIGPVEPLLNWDKWVLNAARGFVEALVEVLGDEGVSAQDVRVAIRKACDQHRLEEDDRVDTPKSSESVIHLLAGQAGGDYVG